MKIGSLPRDTLANPQYSPSTLMKLEWCAMTPLGVDVTRRTAWRVREPWGGVKIIAHFVQHVDFLERDVEY